MHFQRGADSFHHLGFSFEKLRSDPSSKGELMPTQAEIAEAKVIERMYTLKVCKCIWTSRNPAVTRLADSPEATSCICKRLKGNDDAFRLMSSVGALKPPHPEVRRLRDNDPTPLLHVQHPNFYVVNWRGAKGPDLVMERELWIDDHCLGFLNISPVLVNLHFVRRSGRLVVPKSESMRPVVPAP